MSTCLLFQDLEGLTEGLGGMFTGTSGRKLSLWVDFMFLSSLGAQQRYFSYRAILVAIVSQNSCVLVVLMWYRTIIARYVAKGGIAQMCLCKTKYEGGGYRTLLGAC